MKIKHLLLVVMVLVLALGVSACTRSASTPPPAAPAEGSIPVPGTQTMGLFDTFATQTALAGEQGGGIPQVTPEPPLVQQPSPPESQPETPAQPEAAQTPETQPPAQPEAPAQPAQPAQPVSVPQPTPGIPTSYTLEKGEHPYCIARRFNLNPADLLSLNGLGVNTVLQPGYTLKIPQTGRTFPETRALRTHPTTYTVRTNDTIFSIACYFGDVDPYVIAQVNGLSAPYTLSAGQTINIP
jgi:LysM repeat protein